MKKLVVLLLVCVLSFGFAGCDKPIIEVPPTFKDEKICTQEMLDAAVVERGNFALLQAAFKKAKEGKPLTVAFLGGSITVGAGAVANKSYVNLTEVWLKNEFPLSKITIINAGISGTGSLVGVHRLSSEVLSKKPDIVIVEFAVNDGVDDNDNLTNLTDGIAFENILKTTLSSGVAVVTLNECVQNGYCSRTDKEKTSKFYSVPVIDYYKAVKILLDAKTYTWKELSKDTIHPSTLGHRITFEIMCGFFKKVISAQDDVKSKIPDTTLTEAYFTSASMVDKNSDISIKLGSFKKGTEHWQFKNGFKGAVGEPMTIDITAKNIGIFVNKTIKNDGVEMVVNIDGTERIINTNSTKTFEQLDVIMLCVNDSKQHKISVNIRNIEGSSNKNTEILAFMVTK